MTERPVAQQEAATAFYAERDVDVSYYPAIWHTFKVGHLLANDLDRICRHYGLSIADVHFLGAVRIERPQHVRATDLAHTLHVSNAVLSTRIAKLERMGLLARIPCPTDKRAFELRLTPQGIEVTDAAIDDISHQARFVRSFHRLPEEDRQALARIMGELHNQLDRDFISPSR